MHCAWIIVHVLKALHMNVQSLLLQNVLQYWLKGAQCLQQHNMEFATQLRGSVSVYQVHMGMCACTMHLMWRHSFAVAKLYFGVVPMVCWETSTAQIEQLCLTCLARCRFCSLYNLSIMTVKCICFVDTKIDSSICALAAWGSPVTLDLNCSKAACVALLLSGRDTK